MKMSLGNWKLLLMGIAFLSALLFFVSSESSHDPQARGDAGTDLTDLMVAVSCYQPPFFLTNGDGGTEWQLIVSALSKAGNVSPLAVYMSQEEAIQALERGVVEALTVCPGDEGKDYEGWHVSAPLLPREIIAVTLADQARTIQTPADLQGLRICSHPSIRAVLGDALPRDVELKSEFQQTENYMLNMIRMFGQEVDVLICERSTFEYFRQRLPQSALYGQDITVHKIFPTKPTRLVFRDPALRDKFDTALKEAKEQRSTTSRVLQSGDS
jgi:polar amino acid transport system substrate-binding protein